MLSLHLARQLRDAGLRWEPREGDAFAIPDRELDDEVFTIAPMVVDTRETPGGPLIAFNGTVEWALDAIEAGEVIWLPREDQLREQLGGDFVALWREGDSYRCEVALGGRTVGFTGGAAVEAYGSALLARLRGAELPVGADD